jgi:hypothetical protein
MPRQSYFLPTPSDEDGWQRTVWPDACPTRYCTNHVLLTATVGNTHIHWAMHDGAETKFHPVLFWRYVTAYAGMGPRSAILFFINHV